MLILTNVGNTTIVLRRELDRIQPVWHNDDFIKNQFTIHAYFKLIPMPTNKMSIKEFRELGFLQETNRLFFHPLGLALEVKVDDVTGEETLSGIQDYRDDPEGFIFEISEISVGEREVMLKKKANVDLERSKHEGARITMMGSIIEAL